MRGLGGHVAMYTYTLPEPLGSALPLHPNLAIGDRRFVPTPTDGLV